MSIHSYTTNMINKSGNDNYETPFENIESITKYIPSGARIWDPFYCNGLVGEHWKKLGFDIKHEPGVDFFSITEYPDNVDMIVTNPPFSKFSKILKQLIVWDKPFMILCPLVNLGCKYMHEFNNIDFQIIPLFYIKFIKEGIKLRDKSPVKVCWLCYKMNLPKHIIFM
jgi:hypothetical protein